MNDNIPNNQKSENLELIANALQQQLVKDFIEKTELYDKKFMEIFESLSETQELLLLTLEENKKASLNLSQIELDARISRTLEDFEFSKKSLNKKKNEMGWIPYLAVVFFLFLGIVYFR